VWGSRHHFLIMLKQCKRYAKQFATAQAFSADACPVTRELGSHCMRRPRAMPFLSVRFPKVGQQAH
jgi:hypothetical protein